MKKRRSENQNITINDELSIIENELSLISSSIPDNISNQFSDIISSLRKLTSPLYETHNGEESVVHTISNPSDDNIIIRLNLRGTIFETYKETLLRVPNTSFHSILSDPMKRCTYESIDTYFFDRKPDAFHRLLDYLSTGILSIDSLSKYEKESLYDHLNFFQIPYERKWDYSNRKEINDFDLISLCELHDGRICGESVSDKKIKIYNINTNVFDLTIEGDESSVITRIIELNDNRICAGFSNGLIYIYNSINGESEFSIDNNSLVYCIIQLLDGRLCSGSKQSINIWNISTGECEKVISGNGSCFRLLQLTDGRLCTGAFEKIVIWNIDSGECELQLEDHDSWVNVLVQIDAKYICSCSDDRTIRIWNIITGECQRVLRGHNSPVTRLIMIQNELICSGAFDGTLKIWNSRTGFCENTFIVPLGISSLIKLQDGRLLVGCVSGDSCNVSLCG